MFNKLRTDALALIAATPQCTLSTAGPAGIQASIVVCLVRDNCIYLLVPYTADHLFNLEHADEVVLTTAQWQLRGVVLRRETPAGMAGALPKRMDSTLVEVLPLRMQIEAHDHYRFRQTIDFDLPSG